MTLEQLNSLTSVAADEEFLKCCGSMHWARRMSDARPFDDLDHLNGEGNQVWWSLTEEDWREAFRAHPKIGERKAQADQSPEAQQWSAQEQSQSQKTADATKAALAEGNREYEERFGFIFIICASGKSAEEILASLNARLHNDPATELHIAAEEQGKITELRLTKLLDS